MCNLFRLPLLAVGSRKHSFLAVAATGSSHPDGIWKCSGVFYVISSPHPRDNLSNIPRNWGHSNWPNRVIHKRQRASSNQNNLSTYFWQLSPGELFATVHWQLELHPLLPAVNFPLYFMSPPCLFMVTVTAIRYGEHHVWPLDNRSLLWVTPSESPPARKARARDQASSHRVRFTTSFHSFFTIKEVQREWKPSLSSLM